MASNGYYDSDTAPGSRFGRWSLVTEAAAVLQSNGKKIRCFLCRCDCGTERAVRLANLRHGLSRSCGCLQRAWAVSNKSLVTHGQTRTPMYNRWSAIKKRCFKPKHKAFGNYGGRGIAMYPAWVNDYEAFASYVATALGPRPQRMSLDRINNDGHYEHGNLRWATPLMQLTNRRITQSECARRRWAHGE